MPIDLIQRIAALGSGIFTAIALVLVIRKMREEMYIPRIAPLIVIAVTGFAVFVYATLTQTPINEALAALMLGVGGLIGWLEGQMTRLYYRGPIIVGKRSVAYLLFWGIAYLFSMALTQTGSAALHAAGVLSMIFGLGIAVGDNLNLLTRQSRLKLQPALAATHGVLPERPATYVSSFAVGMASEDPFKRAENGYFRLRGQLETGRITREQFEVALKQLIVQDAQGRWWMVGADSGKWYVHEGAAWVEANPYPGQAAPANMLAARPTGLPERGGGLPAPPPPVWQPPAPVYASHPPPKQSGGGCGRTIGCGCLLLVLLIVVLGVGGFLAFQNGAITMNTLLNLVGMGPGDIEVDNFRDDKIIVSVTQLEESKDPVRAGEMTLNAFDVKSLRVSQPGKYRVDFLTSARTSIGVCTLNVRSGDRYQFVPLPDRIAVNRVNNPPSVGSDLVVSTSSLCR